MTTASSALDAGLGAYAHEKVIGISAGRAALLVSGRNAWHGTWVRRYNDRAALFSTVAEARRAAEPRRTQGTTFSVSEVPVLLLHGRDRWLVVADIHPRHPFSGWRPDPDKVHAPGSTADLEARRLHLDDDFWSASAAFDAVWGNWTQSKSEHSILLATTEDASALADAQRPFVHWRSVARGVGRPLGWTSLGRRYVASSLRRHVRLSTPIFGAAPSGPIPGVPLPRVAAHEAAATESV